MHIYISSGHPTAKPLDCCYMYRKVRCHNRQLHKATIRKGGVRPSNQAPKYVKGFRLFDKVIYAGIECFVWGRRSTGSFLLRQIDGSKVKDGVSYKKLRLVERSKSFLCARKEDGAPPTSKEVGFRA